MLFPLHHWVSICWTLNFAPAYDTGWVYGCSRTRFSAQSLMLLLTHSEIITLDVVGMGIESSDTMHSEVQSSQLLSLQHLRLGPSLIPNSQSRPADFPTLLEAWSVCCFRYHSNFYNAASHSKWSCLHSGSCPPC